MRIARWIVALAVVGALAALPLAATAKKPVNRAKLGYYVDTSTIAATINVRPNRHGKFAVKTLQIQCMHDGMGSGTINLKSIAITASGTFKVDGNLKVLGFDDSFKTKLKITGTFKRGKVTGSIAPKNPASACQAATYSATYYGDVEG